jgi:hypothetical protein
MCSHYYVGKNRRTLSSFAYREMRTSKTARAENCFTNCKNIRFLSFLMHSKVKDDVFKYDVNYIEENMSWKNVGSPKLPQASDVGITYAKPRKNISFICANLQRAFKCSQPKPNGSQDSSWHKFV